MTALTSPSRTEIRTRLTELQREVEDTTSAYRDARERGLPSIHLLRKRSELSQEVLRLRNELLLHL